LLDTFLQYFGDKTSAKVKDKCIELLYKWSLDLRHEPKILDAYEMLKRQGKFEYYSQSVSVLLTVSLSTTHSQSQYYPQLVSILLTVSLRTTHSQSPYYPQLVSVLLAVSLNTTHSHFLVLLAVSLSTTCSHFLFYFQSVLVQN